MATGLYVGTYNAGTEQIDWANHYSYTAMRDLVINDGLGAMSDTASWIMRYPVSYVTGGSELPLGGQIFRIVIDGTKLFEGVIGAPVNRWLGGGTSMEIDYTGNSYVRLLDRHLVVGKEIDAETAGNRIQWVLDNFAESFSDNTHIQDGPEIPESDYDYVNVSSVIGNIANQVNYMWYVDYDKKIHFFSNLTSDAPITAIDADADPCVEDTVGDLEIVQDASGVANVIVLKDFSSKDKNSYSDQQTADGTSSFFKLPLPPFSVEDTDVYVKPEGGDSWNERTVVPDPLGTAGEADIEGAPGLAYLCVPGDTMITTPDGVKRIDQKPDRVIGHDGKVHDVLAWSKRKADKLVKVTRAYSNIPIYATPEHPVLCIPQGAVNDEKRKKRYESGGTHYVTDRVSVDTSKAEWVKMDKLEVGDFVAEPIIDKYDQAGCYRRDSIGPLAHMIGYYLSEGHTVGNTIYIAVNTSENIESHLKSIVGNFRISSYNIYPVTETCNSFAMFGAEGLANTLRQFGEGAHNKKIPHWVYSLPNEDLVNILRSYWRGDGCVTGNEYKMNTVSIDLAYGIHNLLLALGISSTFDKEIYNVKFNNKEYRDHVRYVISINGKDAEKFEKLLGLKPACKFRMHSKVSVVSDGYAWHKVTGIDYENFDGYVYNIETDECATYCANTIVLHNCTFNWGVRFPTNYMPEAGDEVKTDYNPEVPDRVVVVFDEDSIREMQRREGGDGHHEMTVSVSDFRVENDRPILSLGYLILRRKAWPITHGSFVVRTQNYGEWEPGQTFTVESTKRDVFDIQDWVQSDYTTKNPVRVWITNVERTFEVHDDGIWEKDIVSFTSQPWEVPA